MRKRSILFFCFTLFYLHPFTSLALCHSGSSIYIHTLILGRELLNRETLHTSDSLSFMSDAPPTSLLVLIHKHFLTCSMNSVIYTPHIVSYYLIYIYISDVKWLIVINRIQNKSFCLHNIWVYCVYLLCVYIKAHTHGIYLKIFTCIYLDSYNLVI